MNAPSLEWRTVQSQCPDSVTAWTLPNGDIALRCGACRVTLYRHAVDKDPELVGRVASKLARPGRWQHPTSKALTAKRWPKTDLTQEVIE